MPLIRALQSVAGPRFAWRRGGEYDVPDHIADEFCDGERAELVEVKSKPRGRTHKRTPAGEKR